MRDTREQLLSEANRKLYQNQTTWENYYHLPIEDFILLLYSRCSPSVYGTQFEKRLYVELVRMGLPVNQLKANENIGDLEIYYPANTKWDDRFKKYRPTIYTRKEGRMTSSISVGTQSYKRKNIEVKFSFLGKNDHYSIRNIRPWQEIDYFLLVFVNVWDDFKPTYSLVEKNSLLNTLSTTFSAMNGTSLSNADNTNIPLGCTVKNYSMFHRELEGTSSLEEYNLNLLEGTTINDLSKFLANDVIGMRRDFIDNINRLKVGDKKLDLDIDEVYSLNPDKAIMELLNQNKND